MEPYCDNCPHAQSEHGDPAYTGTCSKCPCDAFVDIAQQPTESDSRN